jgi:hypothetical protein
VRRLGPPPGGPLQGDDQAEGHRQLVQKTVFVGAAGPLEQQLDVVGDPPEDQGKAVEPNPLGPHCEGRVPLLDAG